MEAKSTPGTDKFSKNALPLIIASNFASVVLKRDISKLKRLVKVSVLILFMKQSEKMGTLVVPTFIAQALLKCFSWQFALYILVRQFMSRYPVDFLVTAKWIFSIQLVSWYLIGCHAEKAEQGYLRMWTQTMPRYRKVGPPQWVAECGSKATQSKYYQPHQVSDDSFYSFPKEYLSSCKSQFPFCLALYMISYIKKVNSKLTVKQTMTMFTDLMLKGARSSLILGLLCYSFYCFPLFYANMFLPLYKKVEKDVDGNKKVERNIPFHVAFAAALSTFAFMQEPFGRRKMMTGYMIWRIMEGLGKTYLVKETEEPKKTFSTALFTALTAYLCLPKKL